MRAHPSVVAFYRQLGQDATQAANRKEGDDEEAVAEAEVLNSNKTTNNIINNNNNDDNPTYSSSSTTTSSGSRSSRAAGWAPSRAPLQPWVCPGFNGGANSEGWIQRPHNGKVSAPKSFEEDTWMDQVRARIVRVCFFFKEEKRAIAPHYEFIYLSFIWWSVLSVILFFYSWRLLLMVPTYLGVCALVCFFFSSGHLRHGQSSSLRVGTSRICCVRPPSLCVARRVFARLPLLPC